MSFDQNLIILITALACPEIDRRGAGFVQVSMRLLIERGARLKGHLIARLQHDRHECVVR
jgi:hypothetical protein